MKKIIIATDVLLDVLYDRKPFSEPAAQLLSLCENRTIEGHISPLALGSLFHMLKKGATTPEISEKMSLLLIFLDVLPLSKHDFVQALNSEITDLECAIQAAAAQNLYTIEAIVTRNAGEYKGMSLPVLSPEEFLRLNK